VGEEQLLQLGLYRGMLESFQPRRVELKDEKVLVYFGPKFLQVPAEVFDNQEEEDDEDDDEVQAADQNLAELLGPTLKSLSRSPPKHL